MRARQKFLNLKIYNDLSTLCKIWLDFILYVLHFVHIPINVYIENMWHCMKTADHIILYSAYFAEICECNQSLKFTKNATSSTNIFNELAFSTESIVFLLIQICYKNRSDADLLQSPSPDLF